jgi:hypothetical protein
VRKSISSSSVDERDERERKSESLFWIAGAGMTALTKMFAWRKKRLSAE